MVAGSEERGISKILRKDVRLKGDPQVKVIVFGADGMLGTDVSLRFKKDFEVIEGFEKEIDITDKSSVERFVSFHRPDYVVNCAGYADVDGCESSSDKAFAVNSQGPLNIAMACKDVGARMVHFGTDYVFDGRKDGIYAEDDAVNPISVYGKSKLEGEQNAIKFVKNLYVIRTQWLYGKNGKNFVGTILRKLMDKENLKVVNDQIGSPTYTADLAQAVTKILEVNPEFGVYNVVNEGYVSWYEFARKIAEIRGVDDVEIGPVSSGQFPRPASRPKNSRLNTAKFIRSTGFRMRRWEDALREFMTGPTS